GQDRAVARKRSLGRGVNAPVASDLPSPLPGTHRPKPNLGTRARQHPPAVGAEGERSTHLFWDKISAGPGGYLPDFVPRAVLGGRGDPLAVGADGSPGSATGMGQGPHTGSRVVQVHESATGMIVADRKHAAVSVQPDALQMPGDGQLLRWADPQDA